ALQHALRVLAQRELARALEPDAREQPVGPRPTLGARHVEEAPDEIEQLLAGEVVVEVGALGQVAEAALGVEIRPRAAEEAHAASRREDQAHEHLDGGGLAGAVGSEEPEDLAAP